MSSTFSRLRCATHARPLPCCYTATANTHLQVTNIGQNAYLIASRGRLLPGEIPIGVMWIASFFLVRILPVPWLLYAYVKTMVLQSCGLELAELVVGRATVPIPMLLNLFWFQKMMKKLMRMFRRAKEGMKKHT